MTKTSNTLILLAFLYKNNIQSLSTIYINIKHNYKTCLINIHNVDVQERCIENMHRMF
jgi:hypothetical protein